MTDIDERMLLAGIVRALGSFMGHDFGDIEIDGWDYTDAGSGVLIVEGTHKGKFFQATFQGSIDWIDS